MAGPQPFGKRLGTGNRGSGPGSPSRCCRPPRPARSMRYFCGAPARPVTGGSLRMQRAFQHLSGGGRRWGRGGCCGGVAGGSLDGTALPHLPPEGSKPLERRANGEPAPLLRFDVGVWSSPHAPQHCPSPPPRHEKPEKIIDFVSGIDPCLPTSPLSNPASLHLRPRALPGGAGVGSAWAPVGQPGPPSVLAWLCSERRWPCLKLSPAFQIFVGLRARGASGVLEGFCCLPTCPQAE